ncbi:putative pentatricopeptide repeat-containing protein [Planoprotostelium fungivorum]|uniref:Putative pentatricopeptide repeat-containing protein n=1 Tax=Planoprotostelium fungivorum TaxID=1890364 RepID=A0A2P6NA62_9EUKA|nr:putative pentatricopeptide repeat-containing protein [Planoprotostelium fungivorum]
MIRGYNTEVEATNRPDETIQIETILPTPLTEETGDASECVQLVNRLREMSLRLQYTEAAALLSASPSHIQNHPQVLEASIRTYAEVADIESMERCLSALNRTEPLKASTLVYLLKGKQNASKVGEHLKQRNLGSIYLTCVRIESLLDEGNLQDGLHYWNGIKDQVSQLPQADMWIKVIRQMVRLKTSSLTLPDSIFQINNAAKRHPSYLVDNELNCALCEGFVVSENRTALLLFLSDLEKNMKSKEKGIRLNIEAYNTIINACGRLLDMSVASKWLLHMKSNGMKPNQMTYTYLIHGHSRSKNSKILLDITEKMIKEGIEIDNTVCSALFEFMYASRSSEQTQGHIIRLLEIFEGASLILPNSMYYNLINLCVKNRWQRLLHSLYRRMEGKTLNPQVWNSLAGSFAYFGGSDDVISVLRAMKNVKIDPSVQFFELVLEGFHSYKQNTTTTESYSDAMVSIQYFHNLAKKILGKDIKVAETKGRALKENLTYQDSEDVYEERFH